MSAHRTKTATPAQQYLELKLTIAGIHWTDERAVQDIDPETFLPKKGTVLPKEFVVPGAMAPDPSATPSQQASAATVIITRGDQHPTGMASLRGKRLVIVPEINEGATLNVSFIKALTGGDKIQTRLMRQDFDPRCFV